MKTVKKEKLEGKLVESGELRMDKVGFMKHFSEMSDISRRNWIMGFYAEKFKENENNRHTLAHRISHHVIRNYFGEEFRSFYEVNPLNPKDRPSDWVISNKSAPAPAELIDLVDIFGKTPLNKEKLSYPDAVNDYASRYRAAGMIGYSKTRLAAAGLTMAPGAAMIGIGATLLSSPVGYGLMALGAYVSSVGACAMGELATRFWKEYPTYFDKESHRKDVLEKTELGKLWLKVTEADEFMKEHLHAIKQRMEYGGKDESDE